ncbi:hypothetical protein IAG41_22715 [Sphingomonas sp. JC676]|uniref:hypothetical protein n=1 Tax=Sphingomonas sp. JC676 TaxID=2768065 RepID=UPI00165854DB|nr:hypothetical protein [Sphingomonas sp. JC676]MBC9035213.1 hypothetical protein [Sphingomonas sp. JC676]
MMLFGLIVALVAGFAGGGAAQPSEIISIDLAVSSKVLPSLQSRTNERPATHKEIRRIFSNAVLTPDSRDSPPGADFSAAFRRDGSWEKTVFAVVARTERGSWRVTGNKICLSYDGGTRCSEVRLVNGKSIRLIGFGSTPGTGRFLYKINH